MGPNKRMAACSLALYTALAAWLLTGCAPVQPTDYHEAATKTDFAARLDLRIAYHVSGDRSFVVSDFNNPRHKMLHVWMVQTAATDGESITRSTRIYIGNDRSKQLLYQVDSPQEGIIQTFAVEVFNREKELLIRSENIRIDPLDLKGGQVN